MQLSLNYFSPEFVTPGLTLIVGSKIYHDKEDRRHLYPNAIGADMLPGDGVDVVHNFEEGPFGEFSHVECISVMEHSKAPWLLARNIEDSLIEGGSLFLSVPFVWRFHGYPNDYFRFTVEGVKCLFPRIEWKSLDYASGTIIVKKPECFVFNGTPFFQRTEVLGIGVKKCS